MLWRIAVPPNSVEILPAIGADNLFGASFQFKAMTMNLCDGISFDIYVSLFTAAPGSDSLSAS